MSYTPAPWRAQHTLIMANGIQTSIAKVFELGNGQWEANARLITAAPELFELLRAMAKALRPFNENSNLLNSIDAIIIRIEGK